MIHENLQIFFQIFMQMRCILNFEQNVWGKGAVHQPVFTLSIYLLKQCSLVSFFIILTICIFLEQINYTMMFFIFLNNIFTGFCLPKSESSAGD